MSIDGVEYVAAAYALAFATLLVWVVMIGAKVQKLQRHESRDKDVDAEA